MPRFAILALLLPSTALAGPATWFGAGATSGVSFSPDAVAPILSQAEVDARFEWPDVFVRIDLDVHFYPDAIGDGPALPYPPEYALVQFGHDKRLRLGVVNPAIGLQGWDERVNYLPTYSTSWSYANGQILGAEPGLVLGDGTELFVFGGYDLSWLTPNVGLGVATEQDAYSTWTGVFCLPVYTDTPYIALFSDHEVYPLDALWLDLEIDAGFVDGQIFGGPTFVADILPESMVGFAVRGEHNFNIDAAEAIDLPGLDASTASVAVRVDPTPWSHFAVEGKAAFPQDGGDMVPSATLLLDVHVPEPDDDYSAD